MVHGVYYRYDINEFNQIYIKKLLIGFILGPDRNSGSGPLPVPVEFGLVPVPVDLAGTIPVQQFFFMLYLGFMMSYLHHVPLQFSGWIKCTPPIPRL